MSTFPVKFLDGHVIIPINNRDYILDTGSPFSFGRGSNIVIAGKTFKINLSGLGSITAESISAVSGLQVDGLIGMDILMHFDIRITRELVSMALTAFPQADSAIQISMVETAMGIPIIQLSINHEQHRIFFDTGAKISYLSEELLRGDPVGEMEDFHISIGKFTTKIYEIDVTIGETIEKLTFGLLPASIRVMLEMGKTKGVIGTELLKKYTVTLSNSNKMLILKLCNDEEPTKPLETIEHRVSVREPSLD